MSKIKIEVFEKDCMERDFLDKIEEFLSGCKRVISVQFLDATRTENVRCYVTYETEEDDEE